MAAASEPCINCSAWALAACSCCRAAGLFSVNTKDDFGYDIGGGVMGFFTHNVGLRGDVRYFRGFNGSSDNVTTLGLSNFSYWRTSIGVSFKF